MTLFQYKVIFSVGGRRSRSSRRRRRRTEKIIESQYPGAKVIFYSVTKFKARAACQMGKKNDYEKGQTNIYLLTNFRFAYIAVKTIK